MKRTPLLLLLLAPVVLGGCQTIREHNPFRHKEPAYKAAQQEQPLEVPPGLNQPATQNALAIPEVGSGAASAPAMQPAAGAPSTAQPGSGAPGAAGTVPPAASVASGDSLTLEDTPASAYHRVGLALARGDVGQVTAHDDNTMTYQVAVNSVVTQQPEGGFFHRLFHRDHSETVTGTVTVSVVPSGNGSVVEASGNPDAATRVMTVLKQRLQ